MSLTPVVTSAVLKCIVAVLSQSPLGWDPAGDGEQPPTPKKPRKRKAAGEAGGDGDPFSPEEAQTEALQLLRKSRLVSEHGIGALWGEPVENIISADAAIRAWRPIQVPHAAFTNWQ